MSFMLFSHDSKLFQMLPGSKGLTSQSLLIPEVRPWSPGILLIASHHCVQISFDPIRILF